MTGLAPKTLAIFEAVSALSCIKDFVLVGGTGIALQIMGYEPKHRIITSEENTIAVLEALEASGYRDAREVIDNFCNQDVESIDRRLLAMHSIVAMMQFDLSKAVNLTRLLSYSNGYL